MKRIFLAFVALLVASAANAEPLTGSLKITGGYFGSSSAITGDIDVMANTLSLDPSFIYGVSAVFTDTELLDAGTHTRSYTTSSGATLTRTETIPSGKVGGYFVIETNGSSYQIFNAWTVSSDGRTYTPVTFPGNVFVGGSLNGKRANLDFTVPPPPAPTMSMTMELEGGDMHQCTSPEGDVVSASAEATIVGNTNLDRVDWYIDSAFVGSGNTIDLAIPFGTHVVHAVGIATDGVTSASVSSDVEVRDRVAPSLEIQFLNNQGQQINVGSIGNYSVHFVVSDVCDTAPAVVSASAKPVMSVKEGDIIIINSTTDVELPTTAVEVTATARDATGNSRTANATLLIQ